MKILSKKKYNDLVEAQEKLERKMKEHKALVNQLQVRQDKITELEVKLGLLEISKKCDVETIKQLRGAKGGYVKEINKLKAELEETKKKLEETEKKLEESLSDAYLRVKVPMGKLPKGQVMKMKSHAKQDKIIKKIYDDLERDK